MEALRGEGLYYAWALFCWISSGSNVFESFVVFRS
jgi:hypothetical protein